MGAVSVMNVTNRKHYIQVNMTFSPRIVSFKGSELLAMPIILKSQQNRYPVLEYFLEH